MKIKDIALSAAYVGQRVVKAIAVGAQEVWSAVKYILFADSVVEQICATNWGDGVGITEEQAAAVTDIGTVFQGNTEITTFEELELFQNIGSLASKCFSGCSNLQKIKFPTSVKSIGTWAFSSCASLDNITLNDGVSIIDAGTFSGCTALSNIYIPKGVTNIAAQAFYSTKNLRSIIFREGLKQIGNDCFRYGALENIELPEGLTTIGSYAFGSNLKAVVIPSTVTSIGQNAFYQCKIENEITLPQGLTTIQNKLFFGNSIPLVNIQGVITSIGQGAFMYCGLLSVVLLPNTTTPPTLGADAFSNTSSNLKIYVPDQSVQAYREASGWLDYADRIWPIEAYLYGIITFADPAVEAICLANWDTNGSGYISKEEAKAVTSLGTVFQGNTEITSFNELEFFGITRITTHSFASCTNLSEITIPNSVTTIDNEAMWLSPNLKVNNLSSNANIVNISDWAFYQTQACKNLHLENLTTLGLSAFRKSELSGTVNLPKLNSVLSDQFSATKVERLENLGFMTGTASSNLTGMTELVFARFPKTFKAASNDFLNGCTKLKTLILESEEVVQAGTWPTINTNVAEDGIYVPDNLVDAYKTSEIWKWRANYIKPLSQYVES